MLSCTHVDADKSPLTLVTFIPAHLDGNQWRIQVFPGEGGANSQSGCANLFFSAENCMKMKEFRPRGRASLAPPT